MSDMDETPTTGAGGGQAEGEGVDQRSPGFGATDAGGELGSAQGGDLGEVAVPDEEPVPDELSYDEAKEALGG